MWSLRNRLLIPILGIALTGLVLSSFVSQYIASHALEESVLNDARGSSRNLAEIIGIAINGTQADAQLLANTAMIVDMVNPATDSTGNMSFAKTLLANLIAKKTFYDCINVIDGEGNVMLTSDPEPVGNLSGRAYFKALMGGSDSFISEPIKSAYMGSNIMVVAVPIFRDGKRSGVLMISLNLNNFSNAYVNPIRLGERGYAFVTTRQGNVLAHHNADLIMSDEANGSPAVQLAKDVTEKEGWFISEFQGQKSLYVFKEEPVTRWICLVRGDIDDVYSSAQTLTTVGISITVAFLLAIALVVFLVVRNVVRAVNQGAEFAAEVANGNLDRALTLHRTDELGNLADSLRVMVANLKEMIATAEQKSAEALEQTEKASQAVQEAQEARGAAEQAKSEGMRQAGERLSEIALRVSRTAEELTEQVQEAANGAGVQLERTAAAATAMEEMNATVMEVARSAGSASESAEQTKVKAGDGATVVNDVIRSISEARDKTEELKVSLNKLGTQAQDIGQVMGVITDVADQTNLLALNAAIEAARAGEAGRGFAVVADEVRKLAEKTMAATREVGEAVAAIQAGTEENISGMDDAARSVAEGMEMVEQAGVALKEIVDISQSTAGQVQSIATASEEQLATSEQVVRGTEEINTIAAGTSKQMEQAQQAMESLSAFITEIQALVEELRTA